MAADQLKASGFHNLLAGGIVLTGGGALMTGATELAEDIIGKPTRLGKPQNLKGLVDVVQGSEYATAVGLVRHGMKQGAESGARYSTSESPNNETKPSGGGIGAMLKKLFKDYF